MFFSITTTCPGWPWMTAMAAIPHACFPVRSLFTPCSFPVTNWLRLGGKAHGIEGLHASGDQSAGIFPVIFPVSRNLGPTFFPVMKRIRVGSVVHGKQGQVSGKVFPVLPKVFENGILSAYVSPSVPSKSLRQRGLGPNRCRPKQHFLRQRLARTAQDGTPIRPEIW